MGQQPGQPEQVLRLVGLQRGGFADGGDPGGPLASPIERHAQLEERDVSFGRLQDGFTQFRERLHRLSADSRVDDVGRDRSVIVIVIVTS
jgi:hypothetical protein